MAVLIIIAILIFIQIGFTIFGFYAISWGVHKEFDDLTAMMDSWITEAHKERDKEIMKIVNSHKDLISAIGEVCSKSDSACRELSKKLTSQINDFNRDLIKTLKKQQGDKQ